MNTLCQIALQQDHTILAELWGDLIEWSKRLDKEGPFLSKHLRQNQCHHIFDACLGDGVDSIFLLQNGFSVTSNEIDESFRNKAIKNASHYNVMLNLTKYDWRDLNNYVPQEPFDAIICLGNSFTYLFDNDQRTLVLNNFYSLLKPGGILIMDERNYPYILTHREKILKREFFASSKQTVYCGEKVEVKPIMIQDDIVIMHYYHKELGQEGHLSLYPFKEGELRSLLEQHFIYLNRFSDYEEHYNAKADFYQHLCLKPMTA